MTAINYYCPECENDQVLLSAHLKWDVVNQKWVIHATTGLATCETCGAVLRELIPLEVIIWPSTQEE